MLHHLRKVIMHLFFDIEVAMNHLTYSESNVNMIL